MHSDTLTIATMCGGAIQEKINRALEKVARNILDPNTEPGKKRTITLKITMKPDEDDNEDVTVSADVTYTLAPEQGVQTQFYVNKDLTNEKLTIMEHKKGEIRGQLDFSDIGITEPDYKTITQKHIELEAKRLYGDGQEEQQAAPAPSDPEGTQTVLDFRKRG